jgi:hypothetical protein
MTAMGTAGDVVFFAFAARYLVVLRGSSRAALMEFWNHRTLRWHPFAGEVPASAWEISPAEAWRIISDD